MDQPPLKRHSRHLIRLLKRHLHHPRTGAEVGVWRGRNSAALLAAFPDLTLTMVDAWSADGWEGDNRLGGLPQAEFDDARREAIEVTEFAADRRIIRPGWSHRVAEFVPDDSMDFVFIDADHRYEAVRADIAAWRPRVRRGGILCGHDYFSPRNAKGQWGVKRAVDEWAAESGIVVEFAETVWVARMPG